MSDTEIEKFHAQREADLAAKAGLNNADFDANDVSDEEVLGLRSESSDESDLDRYYDQDDETVNAKRERALREQEDNWGQTRDNYFGGEDDLGESDGASEEEAEEAIRLRDQQLAEMREDDFVNELDKESWSAQTQDDLKVEDSNALEVDFTAMSSDERRELLETKFPAVLLLGKELLKCDEWAEELETRETTAQLADFGRTALASYKGVLCAYFALFTELVGNNDASGLAKLETHPINEAILMARHLWTTFNNTDVSSLDTQTEDKEMETGETGESGNMDMNESSLMADSNSEPELEPELEPAAPELTDSEFGSSGFSSDANSDDEFEIAPAKRTVNSVANDFDETADTIEQQARAKNKQSLRFYTSQIGKSERQNNTAGGDDDLPYQEREFERKQRLLAEAQKRGQQQQDKLGEPDMEDDFVSDEEQDNGLYSQQVSANAQKRADKQIRHAEAVTAAREGKIQEYLAANPDQDKRAINYQIEKNKGLTRKRKKENRNARVKKRIKYDQAQKRLKGVRKVYQGAQGPYQGESSGIRKNLAHSQRFKS